jgi:PAS domain S-box-containing protein
MKTKARQPFRSLPAVVVGLAVIAAIGLAGYLYTAAEKRSFHTEISNQLAAIADMKVRQLVAWREERLGDAKVVQFNPFTHRAVREILAGGRDRADIEKWMGLLMEAYQYTAASLWDREYRRRVWLPADDPARDAQHELIMQAMRAKAPVLGDLHRDEPTGAVHIALAIPLMGSSSSEPIGALLLKIDPERFLYPFIQSWPLPSRSAETLLVRREGNDVVFLSEPRHRREMALRLRSPVTQLELPAAKAALGYEGTFEGVDYRGVPVVAVTRGVPGSPWFVVAKVDREEVLAPLRQRTRYVAMFFGLAGLALIAGIVLLWSRQAAEALRSSEVRYRRLFESAKDGILILDVETGMIVDVNPFLIDLLGYPREAFLNKRFWELGSFKDVIANRANFAELREKGYVRYQDIPLEAADGRRIEVEFVSNVYLVSNQKVIQCNVRDITERKRAEEALRNSEIQLRAILDATPFPIALVDLQDSNIDFWSRSALTLFGHTAPTSAKWYEIAYPDPDYRREAIDRWKAALEVARLSAQAVNAGVYRVTCHNGSVRICELYTAFLADKLIVTFNDITERKQVEEALRESERRLRLAQEAAKSGSWEWDLRTNQNYWSEEVWPLYGLTPQSCVPSYEAWRQSIHPEDRARAAAAANEAASHGAELNVEWRVNDPAGRERWLMSRGQPQRGEDGRVERYLGIVVDITERKGAEEEKERLQLQLAQAQKMESIGRLAGGVAHDFNNLLTVINGYSRLLLDRLTAGDPLRDGLEEIHKAGERAAGLTQQLLAFSRKQVLQPRVLDLNRVVGEMRPMLARLMGEDVEVCVKLRAEATTIFADPHQLERVLMNLAVNSRDAMPHGGEFTIETGVAEWGESDGQLRTGAHAGPYVTLTVSDTGVGMNEETRGHIFEPFFTTKGVGKGTGLGLPTIHGIVEQSGGYVEVNSELGCGTTFKIYLPRVEDASADSGTPEAVSAMGGKETVLVVEDQPEVRGYAAAALRAYGYQVIEAANANEALLVCERESVDLMLTDVVMPSLSGRELADRLKQRRPGIKVLFMSGYTDDTIVHHGVLEKDAEFIQKPFSPGQLAIKVREVLGGP